jgi:hypothetical protein
MTDELISRYDWRDPVDASASEIDAIMRAMK